MARYPPVFWWQPALMGFNQILKLNVASSQDLIIVIIYRKAGLQSPFQHWKDRIRKEKGSLRINCSLWFFFTSWPLFWSPHYFDLFILNSLYFDLFTQPRSGVRVYKWKFCPFVCLSVINSFSFPYLDSKLTQHPPVNLNHTTSLTVSNVVSLMAETNVTLGPTSKTN